MKRILVYGTLRENQYNYLAMNQLFGPDSMRKIDDIILKDFKMYNIGYYPAICRKEGVEISAEIMEVSDMCYTRIKVMEEGAGYNEEIIYIDDIPHFIYIMEEDEIDGHSIVGGDWVKFISTRKQITY